MTGPSITPRPTLLTLAMVVATFLALGFVVAALSLANGNGGSTITGQRASGEQFHVQVRALTISLSLLALYMASIAITVWRGLPSSRLLLLAYFPIATLANFAIFLQVLHGPRVIDFVGIVIFGVVGTSFAYWYLYRKRAVVAYYHLLMAGVPNQSP